MKQLKNLKRNLATLIKYYKEKKRINYEKQAAKIGVNKKEVNRWLKEKHHPSTKNMVKIINYYDVTFHSFTNLTKSQFKEYELEK